ncbi:MAG TPA: hypothetical protein VNW50_21725, partial [Streptosporangiaceae bacterium]|nr:hypothetical protein [Streptosporangiaceae bacterium]
PTAGHSVNGVVGVVAADGGAAARRDAVSRTTLTSRTPGLATSRNVACGTNGSGLRPPGFA